MPRQIDVSGLPLVEVLVGLLSDREGRWLVSRRRPGTHMEGYWEFPGGKRRPGEEPFLALVRELREELSIVVIDAVPYMRFEHRYPDRAVRLDAWRIEHFSGDPLACEGQTLHWATLGELRQIGMLPADVALLDALAATGQGERAGEIS